MRQNNIELTALGKKERLSYLVERAENIFKVVLQNYDNDVIVLVDDLSLAIKHPLEFNGWQHEWDSQEQSILEEPYSQCLETIDIANNSKKSILYLLHSLKEVADEFNKLSLLCEKIDEQIRKLIKYSFGLKAKVAILEVKKIQNHQEDLLLQELKKNLGFLDESKKFLENISTGIVSQRDILADSIEDLADIFLSDEISLEKINFEQEVKKILNIINILYNDVKTRNVKQSEMIFDLGKLFHAMSERCQDMIAIAEDILHSSQRLCDKSDVLL